MATRSSRRASSPSMGMMMDMDEEYAKYKSAKAQEVEPIKGTEAVKCEDSPSTKAKSSKRASSPSMQMMMDMHDDVPTRPTGGYQVQEDNIAKLEKQLQNLGLKDADLSFSRQTTQEPEFSRQASQESNMSRQTTPAFDARRQVSNQSDLSRRRASSPSMQMMMDMEDDEKHSTGSQGGDTSPQTSPAAEPRRQASDRSDNPRRRASSPSMQMMMDMEADEKYSEEK